MKQVIQKFVNEIDKPSQQINIVEVSGELPHIFLHVHLSDPTPSFPRAYVMRDAKKYYRNKVRDYVGVEISDVYFVIMERE